MSTHSFCSYFDNWLPYVEKSSFWGWLHCKFHEDLKIISVSFLNFYMLFLCVVASYNMLKRTIAWKFQYVVKVHRTVSSFKIVIILYIVLLQGILFLVYDRLLQIKMSYICNNEILLNLYNNRKLIQKHCNVQTTLIKIRQL